MILYKNTEASVGSRNGDTNSFDIADGILLGDTLALYLFILCLD